MSLSTQNTSLSLSARLLCYVGPPSAILLTSVASRKMALLLPLAFFPTAYLFERWRSANKKSPIPRGKLEPMVWIYAATGTLGLAASAVVQLGLFLGLKFVIFGNSQMGKDFWIEVKRGSNTGSLTADELRYRAQLAASWQNWVFNGLFMYVSAGMVEEMLKYLPIAYARQNATAQDRKGKRRDRAYIDYALAGALSFGLIEGLTSIYHSCTTNETLPKLLLTIFERLVLGQVGHLSVACLTASRAIRRDYYGDNLSWWGVVGPAVLFHGTYNFVAMAASALEGNVGWVHPKGVGTTIGLLGLGISLVGTSVWQVSKEWKILEVHDALRKISEDDE